MSNEKLVYVSCVEPVYGKKGKVTGWKLTAKYEDTTQPIMPEKPFYYKTRTAEYTFKDLFGWGYNRLWKKRIGLLAQLDLQKSHTR